MMMMMMIKDDDDDEILKADLRTCVLKEMKSRMKK